MNVHGDVKRYLAAVPEERKPLVDKLHELIVGLYPDATIDMGYKMPTYRYGEGWVALANQKQYVSLYTCGPQHLATFRKKHPHIKSGKGCLNFRTGDKIPIADVKRVIKHAIDHPK